MGAEEWSDKQKDLVRAFIENYLQEHYPRYPVSSAKNVELRERSTDYNNTKNTKQNITDAEELSDKQKDLMRAYMAEYLYKHYPVFSAKDMELHERAIRVEQSMERGLKHNRQLLERMDKRTKKRDKQLKQEAENSE